MESKGDKEKELEFAYIKKSDIFIVKHIRVKLDQFKKNSRYLNGNALSMEIPNAILFDYTITNQVLSYFIKCLYFHYATFITWTFCGHLIP